MPPRRGVRTRLTVTAASRAEIVRELRVAAERIEVVPDGVEPPARADAASDRHRRARPSCSASGTNVPHKNLEALLDGLARLERERPLLAFAGHGTDAALAARAAASASPPMSGSRRGRRRELEDLYAAADRSSPRRATRASGCR